MDFDKKTLEDLERFSRIKCTPEEEPALLEGLQKVLEYVEQLYEVNTEGVPACNFVQQDLQTNVTREDEVKDMLSTDLFLSAVPESVAELVKVPSIFGE